MINLTSTKVALATTIYPQMAPYLDDLLASIASQTDQVFKLMIFNDGFDVDILLKACEVYELVPQVINVISKQSIGEKRIGMLYYLLNNDFKYAVLIDADDKMSHDRVKTLKNGFNTAYDFYYNEIRTFDGYPYFKKDLPYETTALAQILDGNYIGLSNSAIKLDCLRGLETQLNHGRHLKAFDWFLFSILLMNGAKGKLIDKPFTYYRIYSDNVAGDMTLNYDRYLSIRQMKDEHYKALCNSGSFNESYLDDFKKAKRRLSNREAIMHYITYIQTTTPGFWWENVDNLLLLKQLR